MPGWVFKNLLSEVWLTKGEIFFKTTEEKDSKSVLEFIVASLVTSCQEG